MDGLLCVALALLPHSSPRADAPSPPAVDVVFMVPDSGGEGARLPLYRRVEDGAERARYAAWLENESARRALGLYGLALSVMEERGVSPDDEPYHVALVPGGNHADQGFRLRTGDDVAEHPARPYIKLGPSPERFETTFLHETGHVVLSILSGGEGIPGAAMAAIPHTTAALTDRGTAFNEGFAIHLETLAAHLARDPDLRRRYHHESFELSTGPRGSELLLPVLDLATYSQSRARYLAVRENLFAFASAFQGPDYLRVQLECARDMATLRSANQLLQSEGFYASFFFGLTVRGSAAPTPDVVEERQRSMLGTLADMFARFPVEADAPYLLQFVATLVEESPEQAAEVVDVLVDLSHGVFVDPEAEELWRRLYLAALSLDVGQVQDPAIWKRRARWSASILEDPGVAFGRLGPQLACEVPARSVKLVALGEPATVRFDLNTVQAGILRLIPGIREDEVSLWLEERAGTPFESVTDFDRRVPLDAECRRGLRM